MAQRVSPRRLSAIKAVVFIVLLTPSVYSLWRVFNGQIAEPGDYLTHVSGEMALRLLLLTLLITPLTALSGWSWLINLRRMVGLYAFYYAVLHFLTYLLLDIQLDIALVIEDIAERTYITVGFIALMLLIPLAVTSNNFLIKKLGMRCWCMLHRAVYVITPLAVLHYGWQVKNDDITSPLIYALITAVLLALRHPVLAVTIKNFRLNNQSPRA